MTDLASAAYAIARDLSASAIWHGDRCAWMAAHITDDGREVEHRATGPGLYDGTAGIGLFLAECAVAEGERDARGAALGAARHALSRLDLIDRDDRLGFYEGLPGVAFSLARIGLLLQEEALVSEASAISARVGVESEASAGLDLVGGRAGGVVGLLALGVLLDEGELVDQAARLGDQLVERARQDDGRASWPPVGYVAADHLTGFAHGAAGIGWALAELFAATGVDRYRSVALQAFAYERGLFDQEALNWPDLRETEGRSFRCTWCHGAPGIALSRARACDLLGGDVLRKEAEIGLATADRFTRAMLRSGRFNFSLCHGLAGNAQVVAETERLLGGPDSPGADLARSVAEAGVEGYPSAGRPWPSGSHVGQAPGLMLGDAGVGMFLLREAGGRPAPMLLPRANRDRPENGTER